MTADIVGTPELVIRRHIAGPIDRVFAAWTDPDQLVRWWGPRDVTCMEALIDLRVGGSYRIANRLPDGTFVWISGTYEAIDPPNLLRFTWSVAGSEAGPSEDAASLVTVRCVERDDGTEVTVTHERIADNTIREDHENGWRGCLDGLAEMFGT